MISQPINANAHNLNYFESSLYTRVYDSITNSYGYVLTETWISLELGKIIFADIIFNGEVRSCELEQLQIISDEDYLTDLESSYADNYNYEG